MRYRQAAPGSRPAATRVVAALLVAANVATIQPVLAQTQPNCPAPSAARARSKAEPATQPNTTAGDGTSPGNSGSTGWTGGTGGAFIGTNPQGATRNSTTWQPPTARGLDLAKAPPPEC
ncbi:hypothetical protein B5K06_28835 [Rhizobium grahamii]|uniref:Uncharacterized protein n=1 Tax=Rhizobium grahamii TaxID=1120045 RepID=A0A370KGY7_9HYPH|nr:hypothetical protein B5K06_28835 [Rhizobium grahamii]